MVYIAFLRGINVGGHHMVNMAELKQAFERLGLQQVQTYINSGNVIFISDGNDTEALHLKIETTLSRDFGFPVKVMLRSFIEIERLIRALPSNWVNDQTMKCDVMFLDQAIDTPDVLKQLPFDPKLEDVTYIPGTVVWRIDRRNVTKSRMLKLVGSTLYRNVTARNPNTVRKLYELMAATQ